MSLEEHYLSLNSASAGEVLVEGLLTEYKQDPLGLGTRKPGFSWKTNSKRRGVRQTAYQIQVASSLGLLNAGKPDLWDSGKIESSNSVQIIYGGKELQSRMMCFWRVRVWDENDVSTNYSPAAAFEMALLVETDWQARWITALDQCRGNGYHSEFADSPDTTKWVQVDLGEPRRFTSVALYHARPFDWRDDSFGYGFPVRYRIEASDDAEFADSWIVADRTDGDQGVLDMIPWTLETGDQTARYVRVVATKLRQHDGLKPLFALAEIEVLDPMCRNIAAGAPVTASDSLEENGWSKDNLTDGGRVSREPCSASPMMRREFDLDKPIKQARAYVTGLGYYELRINGAKVGDDVLTPSYTTFSKRVCYSTYDVTSMLAVGRNCVGAMFGQAWWRKPARLLLQLEVQFTDGSRTTVVTDEHWIWAPSPIIENSLYNGEVYDARIEQRGWDIAGADDTGWQPVSLADSPAPLLSAETIRPIRVVETLAPKTVAEPKPGVYVFDFGQNFSGWCRLKVSGPAGTNVTLRHAETLFEDGTVNQQNLRSGKATDVYILSGEGEETYEPRFTYHGFRYVQVEGLPGAPGLDSIRGRVVHTVLPDAGTFECSNELLNTVQRCCRWTQRTNFHSVPTDCPQRDERQGWMGDAQIASRALLYNFDMSSAYTKFLTDIQDYQREDGAVPDTVPFVWGSNPGDPIWAAAYPLLTWYTYWHTGDTGLLTQHYDGIKRYVEMLRREAEDFIVTRNNYGDWIAVATTPLDLISTGSYCLVTRVLADMARALGKSDDAAEYDALFEQIAAAFNARFFNPETGAYGDGSQFSNAFPLYLDIVPAQHKQAVFDALVRDVVENHKGHLSTGIVGTPILIDVLTRNGRADLAYTIATQETYPGWGYMLSHDATTIWELWRLETGPGMNSHNHPALTWISEWYYKVLAGVQVDPRHAGWERFEVRPHVLGDLQWARAEVETVRGKVSSCWKLTERGVDLDATVPANSSATIFLPTAGREDFTITESGAAVDGAREGDWVRFEIGSGSYSFSLTARE